MKVSSRGGARGTDESGAWRLRTADDSPADSEGLQDALMSTQQQLESLEQDVLALEFVAQHDALDDICDLEMHYSNPHLEVWHVAVLLCLSQAPAALHESRVACLLLKDLRSLSACCR